MISDIITLIEFLKKNWQEYQTISALFDYDGILIEGDKRIIVEKIFVEDSKDKWFYRIKPLEDYVFIYMPLIPSVQVDNGTVREEANPDANFFRFVGNIFSSVISGGNPNIKVNFLIMGYKPKDLLQKKEL